MTSSLDFALLLLAGDSGGHLFPAVAFAEAYRKKHPEAKIVLMTGRKAEAILSPQDLPFESVEYLPPFPWFAGRRISFVINLIRGFFQSYRSLRKHRPAVAVGFGSYASFPGMLLSCMLRIPTMIHEQNKIWGKANKMLASRVDLVAVTFEQNIPARSKIVHVGMPLRNHLLAKRGFEKKSDGRFRILITGGSQGAHRLNEVIIQTFSLFRDEEKGKLAVKHITGHQDIDWVREEYLRLGIQSEVFGFTHEMDKFYREADMAITRAGANTLFELAFYAVPAVVIPYPHASGHQSANAQYFVDRKAVYSREEKDLEPGWLSEQIRLLLTQPEQRRQLSGYISRISSPDAASKLADLADRLVGEIK